MFLPWPGRTGGGCRAPRGPEFGGSSAPVWGGQGQSPPCFLLGRPGGCPGQERRGERRAGGPPGGQGPGPQWPREGAGPSGAAGGEAEAERRPCTPRVSTPHYRSGLLIEKNDAYTKVFSRAGLTLMWNREDALMVGAAGWVVGRLVPAGGGARGSAAGSRHGAAQAAPSGLPGPPLAPPCKQGGRWPGLGAPGRPARSPTPSLQLELDSRFRNHTCGLCGDYNGLQTYSEFLSDGAAPGPGGRGV